MAAADQSAAVAAVPDGRLQPARQQCRWWTCVTEVRRADLPPKLVVVACLRGGTEAPDVRVGLAVDEVIGTFSTSEPLLKDEAPRNVPHCAGMLRHGDRLALALDLKRVLETFRWE